MPLYPYVSSPIFSLYPLLPSREDAVTVVAGEQPLAEVAATSRAAPRRAISTLGLHRGEVDGELAALGHALEDSAKGTSCLDSDGGPRGRRRWYRGFNF